MKMQMRLNGMTPLEEFESHMKVYKATKSNCCFGFSGGDDSTMMVDKAVEMFGPDIRVTFCNTHVQFKETYKFIKKMIDHWGLTNFIEIHPLDQFIHITKRIGLHGIGHNKMICCSGMKNRPLSNWMHDNDYRIAFTGLRRSEGRRNCKYEIMNHSTYYDIDYYSPMLYLKKEDVNYYFEQTGCPKNPLYALGLDRTGCAPCPNALKLGIYPVEGYDTYYDFLADKFPRWYRFAWKCQKSFYDRKCEDGDLRGYGDYIYRHKWKWSLSNNGKDK